MATSLVGPRTKGSKLQQLFAQAQQIFRRGKVDGDWRDVEVGGETIRVENDQPSIALSTIEKAITAHTLRSAAMTAQIHVMPRPA